MRIDAVVINASPLITLFRSGQAELLPKLFRNSGLWLSDELVMLLKAQAGE